MRTLPEFRVSLTRLQSGETAYSTDGPHYENQGQRTKLGGNPDWIQSEDAPLCPDCDELMSFVAQVDSVEHQWKSNPHSVDALSHDQKWMFGDVGMIYVFFCFECCNTRLCSSFRLPRVRPNPSVEARPNGASTSVPSQLKRSTRR